MTPDTNKSGPTSTTIGTPGSRVADPAHPEAVRRDGREAGPGEVARPGPSNAGDASSAGDARDSDADVGSTADDDCGRLDDAIANLHDLAGMLGVRADAQDEQEDGPEGGRPDAPGPDGARHEDPDVPENAPDSVEGALSGTVEDLAAMIDALLREGAEPPPAPSASTGDGVESAATAEAVETPVPAARNAAPPPGRVRHPQGAQATSTSTGGGPAASPSPPGDDDAERTAELARELALADLDRELADGVDSIIDGSFESVTRLLDQIFDASVVSPDEDEATAEALAFEIEAGALLADESFARGGFDADASGTGDEVDAPESGDGRPDASPAAGPGAAGPWMDDDATPGIDLLGEVVEAAEVDVSAREDDVAAPAASPRAPRSDGPAGGSSGEPARPPTGPGLVDARPASSPGSRPAGRSASRRPTVAVTALLVPMLVALSAPLRLVPPSVRPVVDWLAISLALWAPIVWLAVLLKG
ncbi:MAG: hypothetical protein KF817_14795 [Phycisphaeraceae bacterium]|nr:hypothetical protein [Phycisphaeraceae bacterium]